MAVCQRVVAFFRAARGGMVLEGMACLLEFCERHPEAARTRVEMLGGYRINVRISHQG
jgi:hypothetical protein